MSGSTCTWRWRDVAPLNKPMTHLVRFWDRSRCAPIPVAVDFLMADSLLEAVEKAAKRVRVLKKKHRCSIGYDIEDDAGHRCRVW